MKEDNIILYLLGAGTLYVLFGSMKTAAPVDAKPADIAEALYKIQKKFGSDIAKNVEKIFRLETAHFTSGGFKKTNGAGMTAFSKKFPYGWTSIKDFWLSNEKPTGTINMKENNGGYVDYIVFPDVYNGMAALAQYLTTHVPGNWYSTDKIKQQQYQAKLDKINSPITNNFA